MFTLTAFAASIATFASGLFCSSSVLRLAARSRPTRSASGRALRSDRLSVISKIGSRTCQRYGMAMLVQARTAQVKRSGVGVDPSRAAYVKGKPKVQAYMEEHRVSVRAGLVQHEVEALAKFNISREQILAKWWQFGNSTEPSATTRPAKVRPWNCSGRAWAMRMRFPIQETRRRSWTETSYLRLCVDAETW